jgi:hypothetical protein
MVQRGGTAATAVRESAARNESAAEAAEKQEEGEELPPLPAAYPSLEWRARR